MNSFHWLRAFLILLATCAVVILSSPAVAEGHGKHHKHICPSYSDIDANADKAVTSEEFYRFRAERMAGASRKAAK